MFRRKSAKSQNTCALCTWLKAKKNFFLTYGGQVHVWSMIKLLYATIQLQNSLLHVNPKCTNFDQLQFCSMDIRTYCAAFLLCADNFLENRNEDDHFQIQLKIIFITHELLSLKSTLIWTAKTTGDACALHSHIR